MRGLIELGSILLETMKIIFISSNKYDFAYFLLFSSAIELPNIIMFIILSFISAIDNRYRQPATDIMRSKKPNIIQLL